MIVTPVGIGLVGAGAYGEFCLAAFAGVPEVKIAAVCDTDVGRAERFAVQYSARAYSDLAALLEDEAVEIIALNTPPFLHAEQGIAALRAGKHLFCEKPLALTLEDGEAMIDAARKSGCLLTVDYVMRYNPLWRAAAAIRREGVLGALLHLDLANHAAGLNLPAGHWFWNKAKSGGIWIEHGVHFFDAFAWVTGEQGEIIGVQAFTNAAGREDRVEALARYGRCAAHFYHGFTHSSTTEQTTARLTFAQGYLTLYEWVPTRLDILAATETQAEAVKTLLPAAEIRAQPEGEMIRLQARLAQGKSDVYRACIQGGIRDLARAARDPAAALTVTAEHGIASLKMAVAAEKFNR